MKSLLVLLLSLSTVGAFAGNEITSNNKLAKEFKAQQEQLIEQANTYLGVEVEVDFDKATCVSQTSACEGIGEVGTCMVEAQVVGDIGKATLTFTKSNHCVGGSSDTQSTVQINHIYTYL